MHRIALSGISLAGLIGAVMHGAPAGAATKVWVSNVGADGFTCGAATSPCRTFQQAHDNVAAGGEIGVLDPGDYGRSSNTALFITKPVNVTNDGTGEAGIL